MIKSSVTGLAARKVKGMGASVEKMMNENLRSRMNKQNDAHSNAEASTGAATRAGAIRRFFNAWRRWEKLVDYSPDDYTLDRIGQLESRVLELERARNLTVAKP